MSDLLSCSPSRYSARCAAHLSCIEDVGFQGLYEHCHMAAWL